jgi:RNA exonuclease 4
MQFDSPTSPSLIILDILTHHPKNALVVPVMPGITTTDLSSNWKKLQAKLQADKKPADSTTDGKTSNGIKRKRPVEKTSTSNNKSTPTPRHAYNKAKLTGDNASSLGKKRQKMGSYISSSNSADAASSNPSKSHTTLMTDHDIPASDLTAAYGSSHSHRTSAASTNANANFTDTLNGGLHPTHRAGKYLALDCEMVGTGPPPHTDDLLARVSLVNFHGEQVYDSFVLPPGKARVQDYRTHVSGVTPWHLRTEYARPFAAVQKEVAELLRDKILVGHALKKDLEALQLTHPKRDVRDTSRYAPFRVESRGKPPALRNLARSELGLVIQTGEHSSVEDARATMALFRKEKQGFEEDNRRTFGTKRRVPLGKGKREDSVEGDGDSDGSGEDDDEDDDDLDEEDLDLLEGEEDAFAQVLADGSGKKKKAAPDKKKKRKKKSRTKRK